MGSKTLACVHGSTNGTNGIPISFTVLPMVPLVIPLAPMVPLVKTVGSQYCRQSTVWAKLPTLESHMIQYGVLYFKCINFTNKHCFYQDDLNLNLNSLLVKRQINNPSPGAVTGGN